MARLDLHIGAHKTATSFLQDVFRANQDALKAGGTHVPHHRQTRKFLTVPCQLKAYERLGQDWNTKFTDAELHDIVRSYFSAMNEDGVERILLTDENFLGHCGHVVRSGILYNRKEAFLNVLKEFLPQEPARIYLSVRDYSKFFSAVYGQYLLDVKPENFTHPRDFAGQVMEKYPNWANLIRKVREVFPDTEIIVWAYENARKDWGRIVDTLLDGKVPQDVSYETEKVVRKSISGDAFDAFMVILDREGVEPALEQLRAIRQMQGEGSGKRLMIFSKEQRDKLAYRYEKHLGQIDTEIPGVTRVC